MKILKPKIVLSFVLSSLSLLVACSNTSKDVNTGLTIKPFVPPGMTPAATKNVGGSIATVACGNEASYTIKGRSYETLSDASSYKEQGTAAWYGAEFQGTTTAGCETFDMHAFTAAHRTLPLPSFVRVTHIDSGKSVIVRVNDRGPFESDALIQLSFAAANALGMTAQTKTAAVKVEGLANQPSRNEEARQPAATVPAPAVKASTAVVSNRNQALSPAEQRAIEAAKAAGDSYYVVINTYPNQTDALDMFVRLTSVGLSKTEMASARQNGRNMHQVRIGPLYTQDQIDRVKDLLESNGLATFKVVKVDQ